MIFTLDNSHRRQRAFSLAETLVAIAIAGIAMGALISGFVSSLRTAQSSAYSLAANSLAVQGYEQVRAAKWDAVIFPNVDEVVSSNFPPVAYVLDVPKSSANSANYVYATNFTTITTVSTNPHLKLIRIDCVYRSINRALLTNSIVSYRTTESGQQNAMPSPPPPAPPPPPPPQGTTPKKNNRGLKGGKGG